MREPAGRPNDLPERGEPQSSSGALAAIPFVYRLSVRQALIALLIGLVLGIGLTGAQFGIGVLGERKRTERAVMDVLATLQEPAAEATYLLDRTLAEKVIRGLFRYPPTVVAEIVDDFGQTLARIERPRAAGQASALSEAVLGGVPTYSVQLWIGPERKAIGEMRVTVDPELIAADFIARARDALASNLLLNLLLASALATVFYLTLTQPILRMARELGRIDPQRPGAAPILARGHDRDELGLLARTANDLLGRLDRSLAQSTKAEADLRERELRLRGVMDNVADGIASVDAEGRVETVNPAAIRLFGRPAAGIVGQSFAAFFAPEDRPGLLAALRVAEHAEGLAPRSQEATVVRPDGTGSATMVAITATELHDRRVFVCVLQDITERKRVEQQLVYMATHDPLTGLPNRTLLLDRLRQAIAGAERDGTQVGLLFLDLDRFKFVNDGLGHEIGDRLLCRVAERLRAAVRRSDTVGRLGGDEFVVITPNLRHPEEAARVARKVLLSFSEPVVIDGHSLFVTTSVGISVTPTDGQDAQLLLRNADSAMYSAKARGGSTYAFFAAAMNDAAVSRLALETQLRAAVESDQFLLHYQPKVDLASRQLVGFEGLIRWDSPTSGRIAPDRFIPLAEETGLIAPIGEFVLRTALAQLRAWCDQGRNVPIAINVSGKQLASRDFVEDLRAFTADYGVRPELLEIEITESMAMQNFSQTIDLLNEIKAMGHPLSVDDFGTGYSSLSYLKRLPIQALKVDKSFVRDTPQDEDDSAICATIVAMGHRLGLSIIAEGVETEEQMDFLGKLGCDAAQGFVIAKPLPADELEPIFKRYYEIEGRMGL
ncbi:MAG: EAL domain-containing protein [Alphaproteobacteria bacterium]|nr:EAL domain-containing protein [Alphaproteobacteria bacterium]